MRELHISTLNDTHTFSHRSQLLIRQSVLQATLFLKSPDADIHQWEVSI